jgi:glycosyltransferase involved in cell wall biosynthesis
MLRLHSEGHRVISLSQAPGEPINAFLKSKGIEAYSCSVAGENDGPYHWKNLFYLIRFCRQNGVDILFSHLESANFVAVLAQYVIRARVYVWRHHIDEAALYDFNKSWTYKLTYKLARKIVAVSQRSAEYMENVEKIDRAKILLINLAYDFSLFSMPQGANVDAIRKKYPADILLITVCRLTKFKRPHLSLEVIGRLRAKGINAGLLLLGRGEMLPELEEQVRRNNLEGSVHLLGHVSNVLDYMKAADYLLHPSVLESSCVVSKEAGIIQKPVIVCSGIGDFDTYIIHRTNGFLAEQDNFVGQACSIIEDTHSNKELLSSVGERLREDVIRLFDINNVIQQYDALVLNK